MEDYLNEIDDDMWKFVSVGPYQVDSLQAVGNAGVIEDVTVQENKQKANVKRCIRELCGVLSSFMYNYIQDWKNAKEI